MYKSVKKLTENQREFMRTVEMYSWIADNGNLMIEMGLEKKQVAAIGRSLTKLGLVQYSGATQAGFEGGIYEVTELGKKYKEEK